MTKAALAVSVALVAFAAVPAARADDMNSSSSTDHNNNSVFGLRIGASAPVYQHYSTDGGSGSVTIGDNFQPSINVMLQYAFLPSITLDGEVAEAFQTSTGNLGGGHRLGTTLTPGLTFSPPGFPLYFRAGVPIHIEPSPVVAGLRGAAGFAVNIPGISPYIEALVDFPLGGGTGAPSAFKTQTFGVGAGIQLKL